MIQQLQAAVVDDVEWDETSRTMTFYNLNGEIKKELTIEGGSSGGTGSSYSVRVINGMSSGTLTSATSAPTVLKASFYEYYGTESTGVAGALLIEYKLASESSWITHATRTVPQGVDFAVDVTSLLTEGKTTNIRFSVTGGESDITRTLTFNVSLVEASISAVNFDSSAVYTGNINFQYKCLGRNLNKTVHFEIDGSTVMSVDIGTSHNATLTQVINMVDNYKYGSHELVVYFVADDNAKSNILSFPILYNDGTSTAPMVGVTIANSEITYGEAIEADYVVFTPNQETTDELNIRVYTRASDGTEQEFYRTSLVNVANNTTYVWQTNTYPQPGIVYIEFSSGASINTFQVQVNEIQTNYNLNPVSTNLVYQFNTTGRSNNDNGKETYECDYTTANGITTKIKGRFNNFNWVSDGYVDGESLTISGAARHIIELPMFSTSYTDDDGQVVNLESASNATVTTNGRTFEIEFNVNNVTDINATIIECMSNAHAGFKVTPQVCYMLSSNGTDVSLDDTGFIQNEENIAAAYIKDEKRIRLSFVIEPVDTVNGRQCVNIYINGQFANSQPYDAGDRFASTEFITIGSNTCIMNVYDVKIYNRGLTTTEVKQNYMTSPVSVQDRIALLQDNDILNENGDVDYDKAILKYPCMLIIGEFSPYKGSKKKCGVVLTKPNTEAESGYVTEFSLLDKDADGNYLCNTNVQGTSSQKFMRKNYKVALATLKDGASAKYKYSLKGVDENGEALSVPESTLCWKADYMSTDHANTFNANLADTLFDGKTASQLEDPRVQNTIYGFRCLMFRTDSLVSAISFEGDGCLNNDKGNTKTFGLECDGDEGNITKRQKWEFLNNTEDICFFKNDKLSAVINEDAIYNKAVVNALESCYPDQGDLEDAGLEPNYDYIQILYTWVCQRANFWSASTETVTTPFVYNGTNYYTERDYRKAIFKNEFARHFNANHAFTYYIFMEFVALCDNRAKNMFMRCEDVTVENLVFTDNSITSLKDIINPVTGEVDASKIDWVNSTFAVWLPDLYDLDSCFGAENSGYIRIPYYADWDYTLNGSHQFNGYDSYLWLMIEEAFADEIKTTAQQLASSERLCYDSLYKIHINDNANLICASVVNRDMEYKYSDPWTIGYYDYASSTTNPNWLTTNQYKYLQRGSRTEQKEAFIYKRSHLLYSKYQCDQYRNNNINFRAGTNVTSEDSSVTLTAAQALYHGVKYGDTGTYIVSDGKSAAGVPKTLVGTNGVGRSDTVYFYGGSDLTDIGDISAFKPYEIQLTKAVKLKRLTIGSDAEGYHNNSLSDLGLSACALLEELNVMGCTNLTGTLDVSNNGLIRKIYAGNCSANYVKVPNGGVLSDLYIGKVNNITVLNQTGLANFGCDGYDNLTCLRVENTPNIPVMQIVAQKLPNLTDGLRLVGIDEELGSDTSALEALVSSAARGKYIDNNGVLSEDSAALPFISGKVHCDAIGSYVLQQINTAYPNLVVEYDSLIQQYEVVFRNYDNTVLDVQYVIRGGTAEDPTTRLINPIEIPTRESSVSSDYTFSGWDISLEKIAADTTITAAYSETTRKYTVSWYSNGTLLTSTKAYYGEDVDYNYEIPVDTSQEEFLTYRLFNGWDKNTTHIEGDMSVNAKFTEAATPIDKTLADMTPTDLYALVKTGILSPTGDNNTIIASGDEFDIVMGNDIDFDNVESHEIISVNSPEVFTGTNSLDTGIQLFDEDKSFVLAIDFKFAGHTDSGGVLASCCDFNTGFTLQYASGGIIKYGGTISSKITSTSDREIVVIRHIKGDNKLYIYASDRYSEKIMETTIDRTLSGVHNAPLSFGCNIQSDGFKDSYAKGTVYWAKIWMSDLGASNCKKLASWTRETITMQAAGIGERNFRMFLIDDWGRYCNCCFLMKNLLERTRRMNASNTNSGGWKSTEMRGWLNSRVFGGLPEQWQYIIKEVRVSSNAGDLTTTNIVESKDNLWLPSPKEVGLYSSIAPYPYESVGTFNLFTDNSSRVKLLDNGKGDAYTWYLRSPHYGYNSEFCSVGNTGSTTGTNGAAFLRGVCFGFCI